MEIRVKGLLDPQVLGQWQLRLRCQSTAQGDRENLCDQTN